MEDPQILLKTMLQNLVQSNHRRKARIRESVQIALQHADGDIIITLDADATYQEKIPQYIMI
ncbi:MAG: hypothetical protein WKF36_10865 [Candidatus Nitrosocosmicus sp.]